MTRFDSTQSEAIRRHLDKVSSLLGKSEVYRKLLAYLTERALQGEVPKELDIAVDVFGKDASFNSSEDAVVRVNVRSLRQRLDEYYRGPGAQDALRIEIPKGGYRVQITDHLAPPVAQVPVPATERVEAATEPQRVSRSRHWALVAGVTVVAVAVLAALYILRPAAAPKLQTSEVRNSFLWAPVSGSSRPLTIVLGDLYLYSELDPVSQRSRSIRDAAINSRDELKAEIAAHPERSARLTSIETTLLPKSVAYGLAAVLPLVDQTSRPVKVAIADEFDINDLRDSDVIYIGPLLRLGPIENLYGKVSHYRFEREHMRLASKDSAETYAASGNWPAQRTDYGLFATLRGPAGNRIVILSSVATDIGLLQIARSMTSMNTILEVQRRLQTVDPKVPDAFEVLFSATGFARTDLKAEIVAVHSFTERPANKP